MHDAAAVKKLFGADDLLTWNLDVLQQVCNGIHFAHSRGIVHRDLKPENVMLGHFGEVYVMDWGLAVALEDEGSGMLPLGSTARELAGTPNYLAAEMLGGGETLISPRTDVYLLGGILYMSRESFTRLEAAAERVRIAQERQTQLAEFLLLVTEAETAQRSYLLTRKRQYLAPYEKAAAELPAHVEWLLDDYELHGPVSNVQRIQWLDGLTAGKLHEIGESIDLYQSGGIRSAMALVRTEFVRKQMDEIREVVSGLQIEEDLAVAPAVQSWPRELWVGRWLIIAATALAMLLVIAGALLVMRDVRRRREKMRRPRKELRRLREGWRRARVALRRVRL
jgi:CHASE3 domain sensor protein